MFCTVLCSMLYYKITTSEQYDHCLGHRQNAYITRLSMFCEGHLKAKGLRVLDEMYGIANLH